MQLYLHGCVCMYTLQVYVVSMDIYMCDRVHGNQPYGIEIDFEIRARTANNANLVKIQLFCLNRARGIPQCR